MIKRDLQLTAYDFDLPESLIAQRPADQRDRSRLMVIDCPADRVEHRVFGDIVDYFLPGDILVVNNTRVFPARLLGRKETGGRAEVLLLEFPETLLAEHLGDGWHTVRARALVKSSKRPRPGSSILFADNLRARVTELMENGETRLELRYRLTGSATLADLFEELGQVPLPPYIKRDNGSDAEDRRRYQTRYAEHTGSVAAPTAGLHFSPELLERIRRRGVVIATITLHVGYGTFAPVRVEDIRDHRIHAEYVQISPETAETVNDYKRYGSRIWAVGTTTARALEYTAHMDGTISPFSGLCDLYIYPGYRFRVVDNLITNFHLPRSSLLFLVSALAGRERVLSWYEEAIRERYRFFSYGDAMALLTRPVRLEAEQE
ncbi:MAG: tRNA preQ1(34) S-adenosylmethionine ribosyltransferase-isomerase QueA [Desulfobulbaceae bacterium]